MMGGMLGRNFPCVTHCHGKTSLHSPGIRDLIIEHPHYTFTVQVIGSRGNDTTSNAEKHFQE